MKVVGFDRSQKILILIISISIILTPLFYYFVVFFPASTGIQLFDYHIVLNRIFLFFVFLFFVHLIIYCGVWGQSFIRVAS